MLPFASQGFSALELGPSTRYSGGMRRLDPQRELV